MCFNEARVRQLLAVYIIALPDTEEGEKKFCFKKKKELKMISPFQPHYEER